MYTGFWWGNLREGKHLEDPGLDGSMILKWIFEEWGGEVWTGSIWLKIEAGYRLLWMLWWTFRFHIMRGISWLAWNLLGSQEGLCFVELVIQIGLPPERLSRFNMCINAQRYILVCRPQSRRCFNLIPRIAFGTNTTIPAVSTASSKTLLAHMSDTLAVTTPPFGLCSTTTTFLAVSWPLELRIARITAWRTLPVVSFVGSLPLAQSPCCLTYRCLKLKCMFDRIAVFLLCCIFICQKHEQAWLVKSQFVCFAAQPFVHNYIWLSQSKCRLPLESEGLLFCLQQ
jgi:hypothetical protein